MDRAAGIDKHVNLSADAEFRQVDPRLDRETGARNDHSLVLGLEVVQVGAVAVDVVHADAVTGAVNEVLAEAGVGTTKQIDQVATEACGVTVGFFTAMNLTGGNPLTFFGSATRLFDLAEDLLDEIFD